MKKKNAAITLIFLFLISYAIQLKGQSKPNEYIFHYSILSALNDKVYTGNLKIKDLKKHGNLALGTYNFLEGEMVGVDGIIYKVLPEGKIIEADDNELTPYAMITKFDAEKTFQLNDISSYEALKEKLSSHLPSENIFYAFRIKGRFQSIKCGTVSKQTRPFNKRLKNVLDSRPVYEAENLTGTLVGLWCPAYMIDINAPGYHLHFVSDDKSIGGHLLDVQIDSIIVEIDFIRGYRLQLQDSEDFDKTKLQLNDPENNY